MSWIGFDLDGTLAVYDGWRGIEHIGEPIQPIVDYAKSMLDAGIEIRIMTARCQEGPAAVALIEDWSEKVFGQKLPVTDRKDFGMVALVDDRTITVEKNTGKFLTPKITPEDMAWHHSKDNPDNPAHGH